MNKRIPEKIVRYNSPSAIQFTIITDQNSYLENEFYYWALNKLRYFPSDLMQLEDSIKHFEVSFKMNLRRTYEIMGLPGSFFDNTETSAINFSEYSKIFSITSVVNVFLIDSEIKDHQKIAQFLNKMDFGYFSVHTELDEILKIYPQRNSFDSDAEFFELIRRDIIQINQKIDLFYPNQQSVMSLDPELPINSTRTLIKINDFPGSAIAFNNYFILNQITGNHWLENIGKNNDVKTDPNKRIQEIVSQTIKLDNISKLMYKEVGVKNTDITQPILPTIVIISPYHFPKPEKIYGNNLSKKQRAYLSISRTEQNLNYEHTIDENRLKDVTMEEAMAIMATVAQKIRYLDCIGYLHSRFSYSPVIRLPHIGKSINLELSHVGKIASKKGVISKIKQFGEKLNELIISPELSNYLLKRNGQIFAISDLPFEWLFLSEYPISYTHDVCRLPEFNTNGIVNSAIHHQRFSYEIPEDLISKTLIIHCASKQDLDMQNMFDYIDSYKDSLGFQSIRCTTIIEISDAVEQFKPDLLIFDCHGTANTKDLSSYLVIDKLNREYLTGDKIVEYKVSAPLVLLSACETMPNYGYIKQLSDAFMEVGAYCVTTTFLPIMMDDAATLLIRLFSKLNQLKSGIYHNNWLNFMSHVLRTSMIHETIRRAKPNLTQEITEDEISHILARTMIFEERAGALQKLDELIMERSNGSILKFTDLDNEWLSYSIIGRADLLYFSSWLTEFRRLNGPNSIL